MSEIIQLSDEQMQKLRKIELEMLIEVDRICRLKGIKYSLSFGTLLGAVRHKGFIPWDDDLDIMFDHEEYEKFFIACATELDTTRFFLQDFRTDSGYRWGYAKLRRLGSEYIKKGHERLKQRRGVCIDLFDYQRVPNGARERRKYKKIMFCIRKALYSALGKKAEKRLSLRMLYSVISLIPSKVINRFRLHYIEQYRNIDAEVVSCEMFPMSRVKIGFDRSIFQEYTQLEFEKRLFMATAKWDYFLTMCYGDYMTPPPIEERKGVMDAVKYELIDVDLIDENSAASK